MRFRLVTQKSVEDSQAGQSAITRRYLLTAVGTVVAVSSVVFLFQDELYVRQAELITLVSSVTGIAVGTAIFQFARSSIASWRGRLLSSLLSGLVSSVAGWTVFLGVVYLDWKGLVFRPHPELDRDLFLVQGLLFITVFIAGLVGLIFGAGPGLTVRGRGQQPTGEAQ